MKAILVIDIDDCINVEPCKADIYVRFPFQSNGWVREYKNLSLKALPSKYELTTEKGNRYAVGWNDCIDEILGGNE